MPPPPLPYLLLSLTISSAAVLAQNVPYITQLDIYSLLAPCAQSALSTVGVMTSSCGSDASELQSCVCTDGNNSQAMAASIAFGVTFNCGATATEDRTSADIVFQAYCTPTRIFQLPTPSFNIVRQMITEVPQYSSLAQCVQGALTDAVSLMSPYCPQIVSLYAPCMCTKNDNSRRISRQINRDAMFSCNAQEDVSSAHQFFSAYCNMVSGITHLPTPSSPPGDMPSHIAALDQYSSLLPCAQSAVSVAFRRQTSSLCPQGPQALASCICLRETKHSVVSTSVRSAASELCGSVLGEGDPVRSAVRSAVAVFDFYCSAARGDVVATADSSPSRKIPTAENGASRTASSGTEPTGNGDGDDSDDGSAGSGPNIGVIVGGAVGGVAVLLITVGLVWFIRRKQQANAATPAAPAASVPDEPGPWDDKAELSIQGAISELHSETHTPMPPEVYGSQQAPPVELHGQGRISELHPETQIPMPPEVYGSQQAPPAELQGHLAPAAYPRQGRRNRQTQRLPSELEGQSPVGYGPHMQGGVNAPRYGQSRGQGQMGHGDSAGLDSSQQPRR
ncbi:hypothetical protein SODALDRAFT_325798 [Sodiomyces alkalinus F11]|uniref:Extracellular membrane protein CFEM domain-containing protein n=1 Tax=Sodiomyces alkalinus (strain CBS 110278 / VKM F-3762 / F11) TaxID=1314773 RepID=A0A3N2PPN3_SODAK|nr:hypothetical protein SODALDRAFT_325798 [Sodiomyces alkalinus F11]ROT36468.1 hypothetical protein SODALDRAFT_325798 [Sodiomyces alkalinus F11]